MAGPDLSEIEAFAPRTETRCGVCKVLEGADEDTAAKLLAALKVPKDSPKHYSNPTIAKWLRSKEFPVSDKMVSNHRNGGCRARFSPDG